MLFTITGAYIITQTNRITQKHRKTQQYRITQAKKITHRPLQVGALFPRAEQEDLQVGSTELLVSAGSPPELCHHCHHMSSTSTVRTRMSFLVVPWRTRPLHRALSTRTPKTAPVPTSLVYSALPWRRGRRGCCSSRSPPPSEPEPEQAPAPLRTK